MLKKFRVLSVIAMVLLFILPLGACGSNSSSTKLSGTYVPKETNLQAYDSITFSGSDTIEFTQFTVSLGKGTYKIDGDTLTYTSQGTSISMSFRQEGNSIFVNEIEYVKK